MRYMMCAIWLVFSALQAGAQTLPPIELYGELPNLRSVTIAPDGSKLAYLRSEGDAEIAMVVDLAEGTSAAFDTSNVKTRRLTFSSPDHLLLSASETTRVIGYGSRFEFSAAFSLNVMTERVRQLLANEDSLYPAQSGLGRVIGFHDEPRRALMPAFTGVAGTPSNSLLSVNLDTGRARNYQRGHHDTIDWFVGGDGTILAREDLDNDDDIYEIWTKRSGDWERIYRQEDSALVPFSLVGVSAEEDALFLIDDLPGDRGEALFKMAFDGTITGPYLHEEGKEIDRILSDSNRRVYGVQYSGMRPSFGFLDDALDTSFSTLIERFPNYAVSLTSWTEDWSKAVITIAGGEEVSTYYLLDVESGDLGVIGASRPLAAEYVSSVDSIGYQSRDGLTIQGLLTYPLGVQTMENLPMVVLPHGGPEAYDQIGFDWMAQFFASRGYLVLQPNFRGSSGFGASFTRAGHGE